MWAEFWQWIVDITASYDTMPYMMPAYLIMIVIERVIYFLRVPKLYNDRDALASIGVQLIKALVGTLGGAAAFIALYTFLFEHFRLLSLGGNWWSWLVAFLLHDLAYYINHVIHHRIGLFWAFHHVHHSSQEFNLTTANRGFFLETFLTQWSYYALAILGLPLFYYLLIESLKNLWGIFNHTQLVRNMGPLEQVLMTPTLHAVHHGKNPNYIDHNYGQVLLLWDKLFGTFVARKEAPVFGLVHDIETYHPVRIQMAGVNELRAKLASATRWQDKWRYLFKGPEWQANVHPSTQVPSS